MLKYILSILFGFVDFAVFQDFGEQFLIYIWWEFTIETASFKNQSPYEGLPLSGKGVQLVYILIETLEC